ncbi:MAG: DNA repair protein RadC [Fimbriimonadaceae bacterium]|nr:DNA repair protein RadC [Fimbriimonadaceae bacterium]
MIVREGTAWARVLQTGISSAATTDLLAIALSRAPDDLVSNEGLAPKFLRQHTLKEINDISFGELKDEVGLEEFESLRFLVSIELGRRSGALQSGKRTEVLSDVDAYEHLKDLANEKQEKFVALLLDSKANLLRKETVHIGTVNMSVVGSREVFREAVRYNAVQIIVAHNHPSGDPEPSPEDIEVTKRLMEAGELLDIPVLDHLIIGQGKYVSLRKRGYM